MSLVSERMQWQRAAGTPSPRGCGRAQMDCMRGLQLALVALICSLLLPTPCAKESTEVSKLVNSILKSVEETDYINMSSLVVQHFTAASLLPGIGKHLIMIVDRPRPGAQALELAVPHVAPLIRKCGVLVQRSQWLAGEGGLSKWLSATRDSIKLIEDSYINDNGEPTSFPVTRRAIMAALLWAANQQPDFQVLLTAGDEENLAFILTTLYRLHWQGLAAHQVLEHIHVSKAAGSTICSLGSLNSCTTKVFGQFHGQGNCLISEFEDLPRWVSLQSHMDVGFPAKPRYPYTRFGKVRQKVANCSLRKKVMRSMGWNFYSNEYTALSVPIQPNAPNSSEYHGSVGVSGQPEVAGLCEEMAYLMVFRHPFVRLLSHLKFVISEYVKMYKAAMGKDFKVVQMFAQLSAPQWRQMLPAAMDNYYIRTLLGEKVYIRAAGSIKERHLNEAGKQLMSVDIILDPSLVWVYYNLHIGLGWQTGLDTTFEKSKTTRKSVVDQLQTHAIPELRHLILGNRYDVELYHLSVALSTLDAMLFAFMDTSSMAILPSNHSCGHVGLLDAANRTDATDDSVIDDMQSRGERYRRITESGMRIKAMMDAEALPQVKELVDSEPNRIHEDASRLADTLEHKQIVKASRE